MKNKRDKMKYPFFLPLSFGEGAGGRGVLLCALLLLLLGSCRNKAPNQSIQDYHAGISPDTLITEENVAAEGQQLPITAIQKLSDTQYLLPEGDTLTLYKPFFYIFEGIVDGRKAQATLRYAADWETTDYCVNGKLYIEGAEDFFSFYLQKTPKGTWENDSEEEYRIGFREPGLFVVKVGNGTYTLKESNLKCRAYDKLDYSMTYCYYEEDKVSYRPHWEYKLAALPEKYPDEYTLFFETSPFSKIEDVVPYEIRKWKNFVDTEIKNGKAQEDEDSYCYTTFGQLYCYPRYFDQDLFVIEEFGHSYAGGAHGMYATHYYNFNVKTGRLIGLEEILDVTNPDFIDFYTEKLTDKYTREYINHDQQIQVSDNFCLFPTGIMFSYHPYELMGFALGEPTLYLSYEELKPFLNEELEARN